MNIDWYNNEKISITMPKLMERTTAKSGRRTSSSRRETVPSLIKSTA